MMNRISFEAAIDTMQRADSVLVTTHAAPDGDAIGSVLGAYHLLRALGQDDITVACHDRVPRMYDWLAGADRIVLPQDVRRTHALGIVTDVAQFARCGGVEPHLRACRDILVLDHHLEENPCGNMHILDTTYSAASEIVFDLFEVAGLRLTRPVAECIYVGLVTDTGGFRYGNTNPGSHRRAGALLECGVDVAQVSDRVFETITPAKIELLKRVLNRLTITAGGLVAHSYLTQADMDETDASPEDVEGLVNYVRNLEGVRVGMLFREVDGGKKVKVSMRSGKRFNSAKVLQRFGGGGHVGAAGATLDPPQDTAMTAVLEAVHESLNEAVA